jgi:hypothetical protein
MRQAPLQDWLLQYEELLPHSLPTSLPNSILQLHKTKLSLLACFVRREENRNTQIRETPEFGWDEFNKLRTCKPHTYGE